MPEPPFAPLVAQLAAEHPQLWYAGHCAERARLAADTLAAAGFDARRSEHLPPEAFGYEVRPVWVYANGTHSVGSADSRGTGLSGIQLQLGSGHFACLVEHDGQTWLVDLAAAQFGVEEYPVMRPLPDDLAAAHCRP